MYSYVLSATLKKWTRAVFLFGCGLRLLFVGLYSLHRVIEAIAYQDSSVDQNLSIYVLSVNEHFRRVFRAGTFSSVSNTAISTSSEEG